MRGYAIPGSSLRLFDESKSSSLGSTLTGNEPSVDCGFFQQVKLISVPLIWMCEYDFHFGIKPSPEIVGFSGRCVEPLSRMRQQTAKVICVDLLDADAIGKFN
jgi:hypothetical protein